MISFLFPDGSVTLAGAKPRGLRELVELAQASSLKRARFLLHRTRDDEPQVMLIYLEKKSVVGMHRHPAHKAEIYVVLQGRLEVRFKETGSGSEQVTVLAPWGNEAGESTISLHRDSIWHEPKSLTPYTLYLEVYSGPFDKENDVEYFTIP
jgi:glucose-6-phosphate isomerase